MRVERPRLIALPAHRLLTLVSAPPGFGKTTLIADWLTQSPVQCAWLSLDADDNDPARFFAYFVAALQTWQPTVGETALALLQSPQPPPLKAVIAALVNDLVELADPLALVLDDYHFSEAQSIHDALTYLLEHLPPTLRLILTTRADPLGLPLTRLRARDQLTEIRANDLRFTSEETLEFFTRTANINLLAADVQALAQRTEGWIAGLQAAALSLRGRADVSQFIQTFTGGHRYLMDYLTDEVLRQQSGSVRDFLLQTAILSQLSASLCNAITGRDDSQSILEFLERGNVFIVPLDDARQWYRYHHLFADFLRSRLRQTQAQRMPELHRRASAWFEQNGLVEDALNHTLAANDLDSAARLIERHAPTTMARGEAVNVRHWLEALPAEIVRARPQLGLATALSRFISGASPEAIELALLDAEQAISDSTESAPETLRTQIAAIRISIGVERGVLSDSIEQAQSAFDNLPADNLFLRGALAYALGDAYRTAGQTSAAARALAQAQALGEAGHNALITLAATYELAELHLEQGQLKRAVTVQREMLRNLERQHSASLPVAGGAYIGLGKVLYEWNDVEAARANLQRGIELAEQHGGLGMNRHGLLALAFVAQAQGDEDGARHYMQAAESHTRNSPRRDALPRLMPHKVRFWLRQGNLAAAQHWARGCGLDSTRPPDYAREADYVALARVRMAERDEASLRAANELLAQALSTAETGKRIGRVIEILLLEALTFLAQGQIERAMSAFERCLSLAEPEGYVRTFLDEAKPALELLGLGAARGFSADYVRRLLVAFQQVQPASAPALQPLIEPLTERELEVLHLLAEGLSNNNIAQKLFITVGTTKRHTLNIYQKLSVNSRTQAIARARELGMLK